jgi:hypothetical protein
MGFKKIDVRLTMYPLLTYLLRPYMDLSKDLGASAGAHFEVAVTTDDDDKSVMHWWKD